MKRNKLALFVICALLTLSALRSMAAEKPNILLILVDDMGYGDTGFNGCKDIPTPNIDSIAKNGVRFTQGYVTAPQCAPSRAGLLSGIDQNRFGRGNNQTIDALGLPKDPKLFGSYMRDAGYRTGMVGKWHLGTMAGCHPQDRGFDWFYGFLPGSTYFMPTGQFKFIPHIQENRKPVEVTDYLTFVFGDKAIDFMTEKSDKPFFLYLSFNAPHEPLQAPPEYIEKFKHLAVPAGHAFAARTKTPFPRQIYAAMVSALDDTVGRVLQALKNSGQEENTLIYFLSDNGGPVFVTDASNGPLRGEKGDTLEGGIRIPFAVQWKGTIPGGKTVDTPVSSLDLLPTTLAAAGAPVPEPLEGLDLLPLLTQGQQIQTRLLYWSFPFPKLPVWSIRDGDWKLEQEVVFRPGGRSPSGENRIGLYRISGDIHEDNDLSARHPEVRQKLQSEFDAWRSGLPPAGEEAKSPVTKK